MFINGIVGICPLHGSEVHVNSVVAIAPVKDDPDEIVYVAPCGDGVIVSIDTHRHVIQWLRATAEKDIPEPHECELLLVEFDSALEDIRTVADMEAAWALS